MRTPNGFTLIELLVVVAIIAILAAIAVPNFLNAQTRSKVSRTKADLRTTSVGAEMYAVDQNQYPASFDLKQFSTPIAYLSVGEVSDIFGNRHGELLGYVQAKDAAREQFLNDFDVHIYTDAQRDVIASHGYFLWSDGPDRINTALEIRQATFDDLVGVPNATRGYYYDPTNGITSRGDIMRSAKHRD
ncbi:MAG: prepilin-type N-terminal cleavage/methylation domain-containing protein [Candidatus Sumerlaeota bacterium]